MCSFVVPYAKKFGIQKKQVDEHIGMNEQKTDGR